METNDKMYILVKYGKIFKFNELYIDNYVCNLCDLSPRNQSMDIISCRRVVPCKGGKNMKYECDYVHDVIKSKYDQIFFTRIKNSDINLMLASMIRTKCDKNTRLAIYKNN